MDLSKVDAPVKGNFLIAFADIQDFLRIDRSISDPVALFDLLNGVAHVAVNCVAKTSGKLVKFIGDAILLVFPGDDVDVGVGCLLELKAQIESLLSQRGFTNRLRITAHFGEAAVGLLGEEPNKRLDILGHAVNVASILGRGEHGGRLIISPQAFRRLSSSGRRVFHKYTPPIVYLAEE